MAKKKNADSMEWQKAISLFTEKINEIYGDDTDSLMKDLADFSKKEDALRDECKVTADDWSHSHPFGLSAASDRFYAASHQIYGGISQFNFSCLEFPTESQDLPQ